MLPIVVYSSLAATLSMERTSGAAVVRLTGRRRFMTKTRTLAKTTATHATPINEPIKTELGFELESPEI